MKKIDNYLRAVANLAEAVEIWQGAKDNALYRDGLIQRFEIAVELAWKAAKDYLTDQGLSLEFSTPKYILKEAYAAGVIQDETAWLNILQARNEMSHRYDEQAAVATAENICAEYLPAFQALAAFYRGQ